MGLLVVSGTSEGKPGISSIKFKVQNNFSDLYGWILALPENL